MGKKNVAPMKPTLPLPDPAKMFRHALCFDYCGQMLDNATPRLLRDLASREKLKIESRPDQTLVVTLPINLMHKVETVFPLGALRAFTTELYLKCLIVLNKTLVPRTHELVSLFAKLPLRQQKRMNELYDARAASDGAFQEMQASLPNQKLTLAFALKEMNKTFETWRYAYESPFETSLLGNPWEAAGRLILELRPDFSSIAGEIGIPPQTARMSPELSS